MAVLPLNAPSNWWEVGGVQFTDGKTEAGQIQPLPKSRELESECGPENPERGGRLRPCPGLGSGLHPHPVLHHLPHPKASSPQLLSHTCVCPPETYTPNWEPPGVGDHPDTVKIARQLLSELWAGCLHGHGLGWAPGLPDTARAPAAADKCPALLISPTLSPALPQTCVHTGVHSSLESKGGEPPPQPAPQTAEPDASRQLGATGASCWLPCSLAPGGAFLEELNIKVVSPPKL